MKKGVFVVVAFLIVTLTARADNGEYAVSKISTALLKNSNAVIRLEEQRFELRNLEKMIIRHHYVITILNEEGDKFADLVESYDRFNSIESIEGVLYDAGGKKIKTLKKSDIKDISMLSNDLVTDGRLKVHNFYYKVYPYTIEYVIETIKRETMFFPQWVPIQKEFVAVEKSIIIIEVPLEYKLRYKTYNYKEDPVIMEKDNKKEYTWQVSNFKAVVKEFASPSWRNITPAVMMAPSEFMIEDFKGVMTDWKELGYFQTSLNKDRDILPDVIKQKVAEIVKNTDSFKEKVEKLYKFLQSNTRYVNVSLGIGGWRPFEASYVASKSYGDCKALSNYMHALLKEAGIRSYYTLVKAGDDAEDIVTDFPSRQFNHVIVCVPNVKDTIWLECTSQTTPAGYMGGFTGNRHALLITEDGGKLVRTPRYGLKENLQLRKVSAVLNEDGMLNVKCATQYAGMQQDDIHGLINHLSKDKIKEYLHEQLDFATYDINKFDYKENKASLPSIDESLDITVSNYATITGKRLFIIPNVMTRTHRKLSIDTARKYDLELGFEYKDVDSVEIELPKGYGPEAMPQDVSVSSKFGKYMCLVKLKDNKLFYYRSIERYGGRFPAKDYNELVKFYETIYKADRNKVVLVKNEAPLKAF